MTVFSLLTCQALTKFAVLLTFKLNIQLIEVHTWNNLLSSKIFIFVEFFCISF